VTSTLTSTAAPVHYPLTIVYVNDGGTAQSRYVQATRAIYDRVLDALGRDWYDFGVSVKRVREHGQMWVQQAGLEFDLGDVAPAVYLPPEIRHRDGGHEMLLIDQARLRTSMVELGKAIHRLPLRFRGFVQLSDGRQVSSAWNSMLELPIWRNGIIEDDMRHLGRRP
jgi:hypothetical protein